MKVALVHDYLNEFGGAERVLEALCEIWPKAPVYTAFYRKGSLAYERFCDRDVRVSWAQRIPFFTSKLHSPLRFLAPWIWKSFTRQLADFDVVITSASWYVTKGIAKRKTQNAKRKAIEICYCHTPPRYLYGYPTSVNWQRYWPVKIYALLVNHFMRVYDFEAAQRVDYFVANSCEVQARIKKFYRRDSVVIYPPVDIERFARKTTNAKRLTHETALSVKRSALGNYFLVVSRLVASKNVDLAIRVCAELGLPLKVVGGGRELANLKKLAISNVKLQMSNVEFLGEVPDSELVELYQNCRAVIFPASLEDFGLVPVEAMAAGKPVIANAEGGVLESVVEGKTGVFFKPATAGSLTLAINKFVSLEKKGAFDPKFIRAHAQKFSKDRFKREILEFVEKKMVEKKQMKRGITEGTEIDD